MAFGVEMEVGMHVSRYRNNGEVCSCFGRAEVVQPPRPCLHTSYTAALHVSFSRNKQRDACLFLDTVVCHEQSHPGTVVLEMSPSILVLFCTMSPIYLVLHRRVIPPPQTIGNA